MTTKPQTGLYEYRVKSIYSQDIDRKAEIEKIIETLPKFIDVKKQLTVEWKDTPKRWTPYKKLRTKKPKGT